MFRNPYADALIVLLVVLLIFGPKRLPTLGRSLGQGLREFKDSITGGSSDSEDQERPAISPSTTTPASGLGGDAAGGQVAQPAERADGQGAAERASSAEVGSGPAAS